MSKKEKLIERLKGNPKDFTFDEMRTALESMGLKMSNKGKTSGSRVEFIKGKISIILHKPHPQKELKEYVIKEIVGKLKKENLIWAMY